MSSNKSITVNNRKFTSIKDACEYYNVSETTVHKRMKRGYSLDEVFGLVPVRKRVPNRKSVVVNGIEYSSIRDACEYYNVSETTAFRRTKRGCSPEEVFGLVPIKKQSYNQKSVVVNGVKYNSIKQASELLGIGYSVVLKRLKLGLSIEDAFKKTEDVLVNGIKFNSQREACDYYNVEYTLVLARKHRTGETLEESINNLIGVKTRSIQKMEVEGITYDSVKSACRHYNISQTTVTRRLNRGWSIEESFGLVLKLSGDQIDKFNWNRNATEKTGITILDIFSNDYYKCSDGVQIRYYSKEELIKIYQEEKQIYLETSSPTQ